MHTSASVPRSTTWEILQKSRNVAAVATLTTGLSSQNAALRHLSLKALLARDEEAARRAIVVNWENLDEGDIELLRAKCELFVEVTRTLLVEGSLSEKRSALSAIAELDLSRAIEPVLEIVVNSRHALNQPATDCLFEMCERWGRLARIGQDVPSIRTPLLDKLNFKLALFHEHKNTRIVDAWLRLAHWDDSLQRGMLSGPKKGAYRSVLKRLQESSQPEILQLLAGYLWRSTTPASILSILAERREPALAFEMAAMLDAQTLPMALRRLRDLPPLECLKNLEIESLEISFDIEKKLWLMLAASSDDLRRVLSAALRLSQFGSAEARQTAAEMLRRCRRPDLETLVPAIQSATTGGGSSPSLAELMKGIAGWLKSPSTALEKAAREFLRDFTLENLLDHARHWPTQMCKAMAEIVAVSEINLNESLSRELQCSSPKRRMAALKITEILGCTDKVTEWLMPLLNDPRLDVRVRVIDLLSALGHESLESLIPQLLCDASTDIQDAANRAIRRLNRNNNNAFSTTASEL